MSITLSPDELANIYLGLTMLQSELEPFDVLEEPSMALTTVAGVLGKLTGHPLDIDHCLVDAEAYAILNRQHAALVALLRSMAAGNRGDALADLAEELIASGIDLS